MQLCSLRSLDQKQNFRCAPWRCFFLSTNPGFYSWIQYEKNRRKPLLLLNKQMYILNSGNPQNTILEIHREITVNVSIFDQNIQIQYYVDMIFIGTQRIISDGKRVLSSEIFYLEKGTYFFRRFLYIIYFTYTRHKELAIKSYIHLCWFNALRFL